MATSKELIEIRRLRKEALIADSERNRLVLLGQMDALKDSCMDWKRVASGVGQVAFQCAAMVAPVVGSAVLGRVVKVGLKYRWASRLLTSGR